MESYRPETYGDRIADVYDALTESMPDPLDCVDRLAELAGPGPALELGIGTGPVAQRVDFHNVLLSAGGIRVLPGSVRYAWPSELDLMARLAGLRLRERWGGWRREPYTGSTQGLYVAVYEHATPPAS
jgi:hypothetical protein